MDRPASRPYDVSLLGPPGTSRGRPQSVVRYVTAPRMNVFQRTGTFIVRLFGVVMVIVAVMGGCMYAFHVARGTVDPVVTAKAVAAVEWLVAGAILLAVSKPLGKFLGAGLG